MAIRLGMHHFCGKSAVIFDLTGTLIDFGGRVPFNAVRQTVQYIDPYHIKGYISGDDVNQFRNLCNVYDINYVPVFTGSVNKMADMLHDVDIIDGAGEVIDRLKRQDIKVGIVSNYGKELTNIVIDKLYQNRIYYDAIIPRDYVMVPPPAPWQLYHCMEHLNEVADNCIYIGDTHINVIEGYHAKIDTACVVDSSAEMGHTFDDFIEMLDEPKETNRFNKLRKINFDNLAKYYCNNLEELFHK